MNGEKENFGDILEKVKVMSPNVQKKAFDLILKKIKADSSDKEIASIIKEVLFWVSELC